MSCCSRYSAQSDADAVGSGMTIAHVIRDLVAFVTEPDVAISDHR